MMVRPARWMAFATWFPMMSFGIWLEAKRTYAWDMVISIVAVEASAVLLLFWMVIADLLWKAYVGQVDTTSVLKMEPVKAAIPLNVDGKLRGEIAYTQVTTAPKFDLERHMAIVTCRALENGNMPDFREATWVNKEKRDRFQNRAALVAVLERWQTLKAISREDPNRKNSSYVVKDERIIKMIAAGERFD